MINFVGFASGVAAGDSGCGDGPCFLKYNSFALEGISHYWHAMIEPQNTFNSSYECVTDLCQRLAKITYNLIQKEKSFVIIGGDHSCAIGTWSGVSEAMRNKGDIGLIWIDAHMDAHTPETTESGNIHGMPLAVLLGYGDSRLTGILSKETKIKPENVCLIGIRSFELGEENLLTNLGVQIYHMNEIKKIGLRNIMNKAVHHVLQRTIGYGISIDLDSMDPTYVKAVGTPIEDGINPQDLIESLSILEDVPPIACEIAEYNPHYDYEHHTAKIINKILKAFSLSLKNHQ